MPETPLLDAFFEEIQALKDAVEAEADRAEGYRTYCESIRPHWAQGYTSDSMAAQAQTAALSQLWELLNVKDQSAAVAKIKKLLDEEPAIDDRRAQTLELYLELDVANHSQAMYKIKEL